MWITQTDKADSDKKRDMKLAKRKKKQFSEIQFLLEFYLTCIFFSKIFQLANTISK